VSADERAEALAGDQTAAAAAPAEGTRLVAAAEPIGAEKAVAGPAADEKAAAEPAVAPGAAVTPSAIPDTRPGVPAVTGVRDDLTADALLGVLRTTFASGPALYCVAWPDRIGPITRGVPQDLGGRSEGRMWGARAEVRWQPAGADRYRALYLGEDALPDGFQPLASDLRALPSAEPEGLFLWGMRGADGCYHDPRLPRALDYAALAASAPEARLPCRLLVSTDGQVQFVRLALAEGPA
jgi:hypothetical protein